MMAENVENGRLGEEIASRWLPTRFPSDLYTIVWLNEHGESMICHDFEITEKSTGRVIFVEVKASKKRNPIWWSRPEIGCAKAKGADYLLVYIFNVNTAPQCWSRFDPFYSSGYVVDRMLINLIPENWEL